MNKLSAEQKMEVLREAPAALRKLAAERDFYRDAYVAQQSRQRIEKLAQAMVEKGLRDGSVQQVADALEKEAAVSQNFDLSVTEKAVELVGPDMGKQAHLSDELSGSAGSSDLERFVVS